MVSYTIVNVIMKDFKFIKENLFINNKLTKSLLERFNEIYENKIYKINLNNVCELKKNEISNEPLLLSLLNQVLKRLQLITSFTDLKFSKLWLVNSKSNKDNKVSLPYIPHIDKKRYFKAMIYLHDVSINHGPIHIGKTKNNIDIEEKRKKLPLDYQAKGLNTLNENQLDGNMTPLVGKAGDIVFFDTNTPHKAGIIRDGYYRKVIRFDFERPFFNDQPNIIKKILSRILKE